ncbi:MAG TPA: hypothetical protein VGB78_07815 [Thermoplasmata archaeon]
MRPVGLWTAYKSMAIDRALSNFPRTKRRAVRAHYQVRHGR